MIDFKTLFYETAIIPVIKIESPDKADGLANALRAGGLHIAEVTFRTRAAPAVIHHIAAHHADIVVGAGTVTSCEEVDAALDAGAAFIVSPGFNPVIVEYCLRKDVPVFPGVNTPSLIEQAMGMGLSILKFFPAEVSGGTKALKAFESVYPQISFIPTGGVQESNINEYLACKNVVACGGSWIVPTELIEAGRFGEIEALVRSARRTVMGFLPLACPAAGSASKECAALEIRTPSLPRTLAMLRRQGVSVVPAGPAATLEAPAAPAVPGTELATQAAPAASAAPGTELMKGKTEKAVEIILPDSGVMIRLIG